MEIPESADPVERLIRDAQADGEFDDLPGKGKPIPDIDRPYDPAWWARSWVERDRTTTRVNALAARMRREVPRALAVGDRDEALRLLEALNDEIDEVNRSSPTQEPIERIDIEATIAKRWP